MPSKNITFNIFQNKNNFSYNENQLFYIDVSHVMIIKEPNIK